MIKRNKKVCKKCNTEQFLFSGGLCSSCYNIEHPPNIRRSPIKVNVEYKIPKVSKKQSKNNSIYLKLREEYLEKIPICERCHTSKATEIHHKAGRIGEDVFRDFMAVCHECHQYIELHPEEAKENGWSVTRLN